MRAPLTALAAAATLLVVPAAASAAASALELQADPDRIEYERQAAERVMQRFSECVVENRRRRAQAEQFLRMLPVNADFHAAGAAIAAGNCLPRNIRGQVQMTFQPALFRSSLFVAIYARDYSGSMPPDLGAIEPLRLSAEFDGAPQAIPEDLRFTRFFGDCIARADPAGVHGLLLSRVGSDEERQAVDGLRLTLATCLPAEQQLRFSRSMLRGILGEALYKLRRASDAALPPANDNRVN